MRRDAFSPDANLPHNKLRRKKRAEAYQNSSSFYLALAISAAILDLAASISSGFFEK